MKNPVAVFGALCAMLCLIFAPREAIESARYGLSLCAELIVPSLLPFFAASALLIRLGIPQMLGRFLSPLARRLWGVSGTGASAFFAGVCGGYPLGAQTVAELYLTSQIPKDEAERLLCFCNNSGPSFLIGVIGAGIFSSRRIGLLLYAVHILAAALTGLLFRRRGRGVSAPKRADTLAFSEALVASVRQAVTAVLSVCGFVVCFCVLNGMLEALGLFSALASFLSPLSGMPEPALRALLTGMLELSSGIGQMRGMALTRAYFVLAAFLCGWGGVSVCFQTMAVLAETDLDARLHLCGRALSALLSALLAAALVNLTPFFPTLL